MADIYELDLEELDKSIQDENKVQERIRSLSGKTKEAYEARDAEAQARAEAEKKAADLEKERDFYASFTDSTAKYPGAHEYKDQIKEKVLGGYTVEDATVSVLAHEGKLGNAPVERESAVGGSAVTNTDNAPKNLNEMSRDDKRQAIIDAEKRGDIGLS